MSGGSSDSDSDSGPDVADDVGREIDFGKVPAAAWHPVTEDDIPGSGRATV